MLTLVKNSSYPLNAKSVRHAHLHLLVLFFLLVYDAVHLEVLPLVIHKALEIVHFLDY